jgi:hypothetical protein
LTAGTLDHVDCLRRLSEKARPPKQNPGQRLLRGSYLQGDGELALIEPAKEAHRNRVLCGAVEV